MITIHTEKHRLRAPRTELCGGELVPPFECPERVEYILGRVREVGLGEVREPLEHGPSPLRRIHDDDYLTFLETAWDEWQAAGMKGEAIPTVWPSRRMPRMVVPPFIDGKLGFYALAGETSISGGTWEAARAAADVALTAAGCVSGGERAAFALCRPPGHHAAQDMYGGYCFLNNAALAAQSLRDAGVPRVAILDVDFHHGNGTQAIFYDRADIFFLSLHGDPLEAFPHYLGGADETGEGAGQGFTLNYPLPRGTEWAAWSSALDDALARIASFGAEALVISLGVDTFKDDPISFFRLESEHFTRMGA
ncbi:MAG: histone deacetylase family protein, partial [Pseudomonadota bacterium]